MRIHRIKLRDYRGVAEQEVAFGEGITVVEGANEAGKSSLVEALDLLLEFYDDTAHKRVASVRPTHADLAPQVEAEISAGPYRFVYSKRWSRRSDAATQLRVLQPRADSLTGREAHDRVRKMLAETTDLDLWRALRIQQNDPLDLPNLREKATLAHALDAAAAGPSPAGGSAAAHASTTSAEADDAALITRARQEYEHFFTPKKGEPTGEHAKAAADLAAAGAALEECRGVLDRISHYVDEHARVERELATLDRNKREHAPRLAQYQARWRELEERERQVSQLAAQSQVAQSATAAAADALATRETLRADESAARDKAAQLAQHATGSAQAHAEAADRHRVAEAQAQAARRQTAAAQCGAARAAADREHLRDLRDGAALKTRVERASALREQVAAAQRALAVLRVDQGALERIERAHGELVEARLSLEAASARLQVEAIGDAELKLDVDGAAQVVRPGGAFSHLLTGASSLTIGELVRIRVEPGEGERDLKARHDAASAAFSALCADRDVGGLEDARRAVAARRDAESTLTNARSALTAELNGSTLDALRDEAAAVDARVDAYRAARDDSPLPEDAAAADALAAESAARLKELREQEAERAADARRHDTFRQDAKLRQAVDGQEAASAGDAAASLAERLAEARERESDEALAERVADTARHARDALAKWREAALAHQADDPESVKAYLANEVALGERLANEGQGLREQLASLNASLFRDQDAQERYNAAADRYEALERMHESLKRRAEAARLLYRTLAKNRDEARLAYIEPFRAKVERLARIVFGERLSLEVDENLAVTHRTLNGVTVPYEQLSGGAREQLALCARLAVAALVDPADGVPVVIDDALGFTDPERLHKVGAMFAAADSRSQVIVLTCTPERYRGIGTATVRRIGRGPAAPVPAPASPADPLPVAR